jgi:Fanconi anemia group M protein
MIEAINRGQEAPIKASYMIKNITPRLYQETILSTCVEKNCLVVLPTGMGKTMIAVMLASYRLKNFPSSKILFLAPTRPLVEQHYSTFKKNLDVEEKEMAVFTGQVSPEKRGELWKQSKIIFSTPQGLENDIITNRIDLSEVSLLVFDEAHRATGDYAYAFIAKQYDKKARYPRILALTASPGSEVEKINEVCKNLCIEAVELRTDTDPDVAPYIQETNISWVKVNLPEEFKKIQQYIKACCNSKLNEAKKLGYIDASRVMGKTELLKTQGYLHAEISKGDKSFEIMRSVSLIAEAMKAEHAIELLETQGISPLQNYFEKIYEEAQTSNVKAVKNLASDLNFKSAFVLTKRLVEQGIEHPKLAEMKRIVAEEVAKNPAVKIIVFNQYRESAKNIQETISTIPNVVAKMFFGQAKKNGTGLSQKEQKAMLDEFREGKFNVLVATSVAEEGIDIPYVDLVMFYEPIPSGIRTIQRRGRTGRQDKGRVIVLMASGTRDEGYKWSAHHKEKRMYRELETLRNKFGTVAAHRRETNLQKFISPETEIKVFADVRERASGTIKEMIELGVSIDLQTLNVGDYILSDRVGVEYKKVPDFVDSIIDGRLLEQLKALKNSYERPIILVEGEEDIYSQRNIHPNAIRGMLATIIVSYGIPVIQTKNAKETAVLMAVIAKREQDPNSRDFNPHGSKKPATLHEQQEYLVSALPGIGPTLARPLLEKFGSVRKLFNATEKELKEVEKIGDKKAEEIQRVLDERYDKK